MTDKLPSDASPVNTSRQQLIFYPEAADASGRALRIMSEVDSYYHDSFFVSPELKERDALCAIDLVRYLAARGFCLCLHCLLSYANGDKYLWYCLRSEVLEVVGMAAIKIAHRSIVSD